VGHPVYAILIKTFFLGYYKKLVNYNHKISSDRFLAGLPNKLLYVFLTIFIQAARLGHYRSLDFTTLKNIRLPEEITEFSLIHCVFVFTFTQSTEVNTFST